jgi:hypothetical protein
MQTALNGGGEVVLYEAPDGGVRLDVRLDRETVWLSQRQMSVLFKTSTDNVGLHLKNIFKDGELEESATTEEYSAVQKEGRRGVRRKVKYYNLDAIIPLTVKKIPKAVLSRCEWDKDDYSLKVENLPRAPPPWGRWSYYQGQPQRRRAH